ncbi:MAG: hypothetical protein U0R52_08455 [Solirubrobacterales bacterium]
MSRPWRLAGGLVLAGLMLVLAPAAQASFKVLDRLPNGVERIKYRIGPLDVAPGQNKIRNRTVVGSERPAVDGWIVRMKPDLVWHGGSREGHAPSTEKVMFHHGVFINLSRTDATTGGRFERFMGSGEEKTIMQFPRPFAYRYKASDHWLINEMIHNLSPQHMTLDISYTIDFIPDTSPAADGLRAVRPVWMDVENGSGYPVFDVHKGEGGGDGVLTYPDEVPNAYPPGVHKNFWTVDRDGVLVSTAAHVHTGGLAGDLYLHRDGAEYAGPRCSKRPTARQRRACRAKAPNVVGDRVHLFRSGMKYYEPAGPVSWDMSAKGTPDGWRVAVHKGDRLEVTADYETKIGSWYESMGIMVVYMADGGGGKDPYATKVDYPGEVTHGHLPENSVHGGKPTDLPDPRKLPGASATGDPFLIAGFAYGDATILPGGGGTVPLVKQGQSLTFKISDSDRANQIWHSLTSCAAPCNRSTGIAYPLPDGKYQFDSGQMGNLNGNGSPPTVPWTSWKTPNDLPPGTYTFFCRIHFQMRGAFRVVK